MTHGIIIGLSPKERLWQDEEAIATIYRNLGSKTAEQVISRAIAEVAVAMAGVAAQVRLCDLADLPRHLRRLQSLAENLGLISLAQVAGDARDCLLRRDDTAFGAVFARLTRVAEQSLSQRHDLLDQSLR